MHRLTIKELRQRIQGKILNREFLELVDQINSQWWENISLLFVEEDTDAT